MSYSKRYRERTIEYRQAGHSLEATHQVFKVSKSTIQKWEKQLKETGNLEKKDLHRSFRKIDPEKLKAYVAAHPDAYQSEMAEAFGCSESGIRDALRRHKITRKKRRSAIRSRTSKR
jgi:transposase